MSRFIRFENTIINYHELIWVGILQNIMNPDSGILSFQFNNPANNFTLTFINRAAAVGALNSFENVLHSATPNLVFPSPLPMQT